jgi:indoleamine 2,3-dioxygenase
VALDAACIAPMDAVYTRRGFLPEPDPLESFAADSELAVLDRLGQDLPGLLEDRGFRDYARGLKIPHWPESRAVPEQLPALRLYYVRLGFLASGYINQVGEPGATVLPRNIAIPLVHACRLLQRPPILSYDGYALYNWRRLDRAGPIALGNIDTLQNFVHLYDEHWFILVHVEIEAIAADILGAIATAAAALASKDSATLNRCLVGIGEAVRRQGAVLRRIPEQMSPRLYYKTFRPYIRFFENVVYEGVEQAPVDHRGETGAQSSIMPALIGFLKIPHRPSPLVDHLSDMRRYMPAEHRALLEEIAALPSARELADREAFNEVLEAIAAFREVHYGWAQQYIQDRVADPRGTGGTPYMEWLHQLIEETRAWRL